VSHQLLAQQHVEHAGSRVAEQHAAC
jgi:hypothetical protein